VIDDGEMGKATWITYLYERTTGLEARALDGSFSSILPASRDRQHFPDCGFAQGAFLHRVHEEIQWAILSALVKGAQLASRELWGANST
jgi:hypothetical protein